MVNLGFWFHFAIASRDTKKPILCLAPMADVTDSAFRYIIAKHSKPINASRTRLDAYQNIDLQGLQLSRTRLDSFVIWTEFVSADGLVLAHEAGRQKLLKDLEYSEIERPIVAQLFGSRPENMHKAAKLVASLGFEGLDINMGCPDKSIEKQGAGAAMIKNPQLAREIIRAAKAGVLEYASEAGKEPIPVSVKTRLGYNHDELEEWLPELLAEEPAVITIHARTRKEMSKVPARWERIKRAVEIRDITPRPPLNLRGGSEHPSPLQGEGVGAVQALRALRLERGEVAKTLIFGNGDVESIADAYQKAEETGCDGVMLGRAIFGNPWLFANLATAEQSSQIEHPAKLSSKLDIDPQLRLKVLIEHIKLFDQNLGTTKSFAVMKKHFKSYLLPLQKDHVDGKSGAELKSLKEDLLQSSSAIEAVGLIDKFIHNNIK